MTTHQHLKAARRATTPKRARVRLLAATVVLAVLLSSCAGKTKITADQANIELPAQFTKIFHQATGVTPTLTPSHTHIPCGGFEGTDFSSVENGYVLTVAVTPTLTQDQLRLKLAAAFQAAGWQADDGPEPQDQRMGVIGGRRDPVATIGLGTDRGRDPQHLTVFGRFDIQCLPVK